MAKSRVRNKNGGSAGEVDGRLVQGELTRNAIVKVARRLFENDGFEATSIQAILDASSQSRGSLYHHFRNKEALFEAVVEDAYEEFSSKTLAAALKERDPLKRMKAGCVAWLELTRNPKTHRLVHIDPPIALGWEGWRKLDQKYFLGQLEEGVKALAVTSDIDQSLVPAITQVLLAGLNEAASLEATKKNSEARARVRKTIELLLDRLFVKVVT